MRRLLLLPLLLLTACSGLHLGHVEPPIEHTLPNGGYELALVLGCGGSKGLAHLGVIHELRDAGIHPDLIVGCSAGGLIGALHADDPESDTLAQLLIGLRRSDVMDFSIFDSPYGIVKGDSLREFLHTQLEAKTFKELKIPLVVVATDLASGQLTEFGEGELITPIEASAAVPGIFKPVNYQGRVYIDGGATSPVPVPTAKKCGAKFVIAIDVAEKLTDSPPNHLFGVAKRSAEIAYLRLAELASREADVLIKMNFEGLGMFSDGSNQEIYDQGRHQAREALPKIKTLLKKSELIK